MEGFMKKVLVLLAEGFEEVEAITPVDYLRRAGIDVTIAALGNDLSVKGSKGIKVSADTCLNNITGEGYSAWDGIIVPGGLPGADNIAASKEAGDLIKAIGAAGKLVAAICAAPVRVLFPLGILDGKKFTCYPGLEKAILSSGKGNTLEWKQDRVVVDGNIITSRGPGTAGEFACAIIDKLLGDGEGEKIAGMTLIKP